MEGREREIRGKSDAWERELGEGQREREGLFFLKMR